MDESVIKKRAAGRPLIDLVGKRFGLLEVIRFHETKNGRAYWLCRCECGTMKTIAGHNLKRIISCGCAKRAAQEAVWIRRRQREAAARRAEEERQRAERRQKEFLERQMIRNQEAGLRFDDFWMFGPGGQEWFESMVI